MKKKQKIFLLILIIIALAFIFVFCSSRRRLSESTQGMKEAEGKTFVRGVNPFVPSYCVTDGGILCVYGGNIRYFDLTEKQEYVLCTRINCTHLTDSCSSFYAGIIDELEGVALYQGYVYRFQKSQRNNAFELIRTDTYGSEKKTIISLDVGDYENGSWSLNAIGNVNYMGGFLFAEASFQYITEDGRSIKHVQCIGIDLETEEIFEVTKREPRESDCNIVGIKQGVLLLRNDWFDDTKDENLSDSRKETWMTFDIKKKELTVLDETTKKEMLGENGENTGWLTRYIIVGEYDGDFLFFEQEIEKQRTDQNIELQCWDVEKNEKRYICTLEDSELMRLNEDMVHNAVIDQEYILFYHYINDGEDKEVCKVDLATGNIQVLFEVPDDWDYRITEETVDGKSFLLKKYADLDVELYIISKEDYNKGNLEGMTLLRDFTNVYL